MKLLVIHSRDLEKGSTKFRFVQYQDFLKKHDIHIDYIRYRDINSETLEKLPGYDLVVNQKCLMNIGLSKEIRKRSRRILFDFDDAIWTRPGKPYGLITGWRVRRRLQYWLNGADVVTTANGFLADYARQYSQCVRVVPMAIDIHQWQPLDTKKSNCTIGWAGSPATLKNLGRLEHVLQQILERHSNVVLSIFSGARPGLQLPYDYVAYQAGKEAEFIRRLDIGLLPLPREEYAMGKSPIKAIQYLACGVPVVGDIIGASQEILTPENSFSVKTDQEWIQALAELIKNSGLRKEMGHNGLLYVRDRFNTEIVRQQLLEILRDSCG